MYEHHATDGHTKQCFRTWHSVVPRLLLLLLGVMAGTPVMAAADLRDAARTLVQGIVADKDAEQFREKTVVVAPFRNRCTDEDIDAVVLQEKLITAFVKSKWCKVVEREQLAQALKELKLDATSGLIDPASQKKLGGFLGASYLLVGTLSGDAADLSLDARLIAIATGEILASAEYDGPAASKGNDPADEGRDTGESRSTVRLIAWTTDELTVSSDARTEEQAQRDAVSWLVEDNILEGARDVFTKWQPEITTKIYRRPKTYILEVIPREDAYFIHVRFTQLMRDLVQIIFGKVTPRIAIDTQEQILRHPVPDPAVQTTLAGALNRMGFQIVDSAQAHQALSRESLLQALNGDQHAVNLVQDTAGELHADIFALGDSFAEERNARDGFDARVEYRLVEGATARLLASIDSTASITKDERPNIDPLSGVAAKLALQRAAEHTVMRMSSEILKAYGQPVYRLRVWRVKSYADRDKILRALKTALPGATVRGTTLDLRNTRCAVFTIETKKDADAIAVALEQCNTTVTSIECRSIVGDLR